MAETLKCEVCGATAYPAPWGYICAANSGHKRKDGTLYGQEAAVQEALDADPSHAGELLKNIRTPINFDELAQKLGINPNYIRRRFGLPDK